MAEGFKTSSWPTPPAATFPAREDFAFERLWNGFMTARILIALVLLLLQGFIYGLGQPVEEWLALLCGCYLAAALAVRILARPQPPGQTFDPQWVATIGVDLIVFSVLQHTQAGGINYTPLFALPVLLASVLGPVLLALGTAAVVTLLLLADAWSFALQVTDGAPRFLQAGLTGTGIFVVAFLANQLAARLAREEQLALRSQLAARVQSQVNELVIETLADGILVVDANGIVRAANPAARVLLGTNGPARMAPFVLAAEPGWQPLVELARLTFARRGEQVLDISVEHAGQNPRRIRVQTRLTAPPSDVNAEGLCVMFLQDQRELEAKLRTEKLAAMGRMSAAVAHEIRNPLAAIAQANQLLEEDLHEPAHVQLTLMVRQNAQRLARIVEEVLDVSRARHPLDAPRAQGLPLDDLVVSASGDWMRQTASAQRVKVAAAPGGQVVVFEDDHLRRVLVNLLDNALRYAGRHPDSIQVATGLDASGQPKLMVWSDGAPLEQTVQRHLFEPFFSSESRSSGLGLYICRELCERHGAHIGYERAARTRDGQPVEGNEFFVVFRAAPVTGTPQPFDTILV